MAVNHGRSHFIMAMNIGIQKRQAVYLKYGKRCAYCGMKLSFTEMQVDHVEPLNRTRNLYAPRDIYGNKMINEDIPKPKRGSNKESNLNPSCAGCNSSKSNLSIDEWREKITDRILKLEQNSTAYRIGVSLKKITVRKAPILFYFEKVAVKKSST